MQKFQGTITTHNPTAVPKIWEAHHDTGRYQGRNSKDYASKLSVWVPVPRTGEHVAGVFIRLSNPVGTSYARLTAEEFAELFTFFRTNYKAAAAALEKASTLTQIYSEAERALVIGAAEMGIKSAGDSPVINLESPQDDD